MTTAPTGSASAEHAFDTSSLAMLRQWLEHNPALYEQLGSIARFKLVIDANFVLADLRYRSKYPQRGATALEELIRSTVFEVHAPRWLEIEVGKQLPLIARKKGLDLDALQQHWLKYQALLHWDESESAPDYACRREDPKDLPYVRLAARIGAFGILSVDSDIAAMGGQILPRDFVLSARHYARSATVSFSIRTFGIILSGLSLHALLSMVRAAAHGLLALPEPARALLLAGVILVLAHPGSRRWLAAQLQVAQEQLRPLGEILLPMVLEAKRFAEKHHIQAEQHLAASRAVAPPPPARRRKRRVQSRPLNLQRLAGPGALSSDAVVNGVARRTDRLTGDAHPLPALPRMDGPVLV